MAKRGCVVAFDGVQGLGVVRDDAGREWSFHAARIADQSRTIEAGAAVVFETGPGPAPGSWEATAVVKVG